MPSVGVCCVEYPAGTPTGCVLLATISFARPARGNLTWLSPWHVVAWDVARVVAFRSAQPQELATRPQVPQQDGLADNDDGDDGPVTAGTVADEMAQDTIPEPHP